MSASKRDRDFGRTIGLAALESVESETIQPRPNLLAQRGSALSKLGSDVVYNQLLWVDPATCRPSKVNARDYDALTYDDCAELIETLKSEGQQRTAAIVRPTGDEDHSYEIVAGLRRHWSIGWLRAHNYPDFKYLVDVQKLDDESAFRLSDLENRARADITDLERGRSYKDALASYYGGDFEQMAERIGISSRNLRRYIQLAEVDPVIIRALGGYRAARVAHGQTLRTEGARSARHVEIILTEAAIIAEEQTRRAEAGEGAIAAADVVRRLTRAANAKPKRSAPPITHAPVQIAGRSGQPMIEFVAGTARTAATIKLLPKANASREEMQAAVADLVDRFFDARQNPGR